MTGGELHGVLDVPVEQRPSALIGATVKAAGHNFTVTRAYTLPRTWRRRLLPGKKQIKFWAEPVEREAK